ncbi:MULTISPECIES: hypothetical protein [unclassified Rhizobium]|uniref:hypothetical protein n=1 Tax=unclassified Rhizobium TaxID=2613769 RepID=UPI00288A0209|nr:MULTISPECIES: hypothetical protein [unclassified Rhizobium]
MTTATLGFAIDSSPAGKAASELDSLVTAATRTEAAVDRMGASASRAVTKVSGAGIQISQALGVAAANAESLSKRIESALNVRSSFGDRSKDIAAYGQELDRLRGKFNPVFSVLQNYKTALGEIRQAQKLGAISADEMAAAIGRERQAALSSIAALKGRQQAGGGRMGGGFGGGQSSTGNIAAQLFDTLSTAPYMGAAQVGLQQGPQFAQAFAGQSTKQALMGLASGVAAIVSPVSLAAIGLTTAAAAAVSFGVGILGAGDKTEKFKAALENHEILLRKLEERYGSLIDKVKGYGAESSKALQFQAGADTRGLMNSTKLAGEDFFAGVGTQTRGGFQVQKDWTGPGFAPFAKAITQLRNEAKAGKPDFDAFYNSLYNTAALDPKFAKKADELAKLVAQFREGSRALEEMQRIQRALFDDRGPNGMLLSQGATNRDDMGNLALFESQNVVAEQRRKQAYDAQITGINARSPAERAAAARAQASSQYNGDETAAQRRIRIEQAGSLALAQAEKQLADAQRERSQSLDKILKDQQVEIDLVGKTGGAAAALRKEYELTSALRLEAARQGIEVDQRELDLIKERAAELGRLTDAYNQARFGSEMSQQSSDARMSSRDRQVTTTLRQYNLPEDLNGANAQRINQQLNWQEAKDAAKGFGAAFSSELINGSHNIGKALLKGLQTSLENEASKLWEKFFDGIGNIFADWLTGGTGATKGASGGGGIASSIVSAVAGGAANDNTAKVIPVTRSALADIPTTDIAKYIASAATARGIDPNIALKVAKSEGGLNSWNMQSGVMKNGVQEPSFGPYQLYMGGGLGNAFQKKTGLDPRLAANGPAGVDFALDNAKQSGWGAWYGAKKVGVGNWDGIGKGGMNGAADAVSKLADSAGAATTGLDTLGGGLSKIGQSLSTSFFPSAPAAGGGGGGLSWLSSLFGGGGDPALSKYKPLTGLFANGTNYAPGGMAIVGERGPELVDLPQGSKVFSNGKSNQMLGMVANGNEARGPSQLNVSIVGASGDNHVRMLVQQGVAAALAAQDDQDRRGGFGARQARYSSQKG